MQTLLLAHKTPLFPNCNGEVRTMSRHPSFGKSNKSVKKRNVLKRFERVDALKKLGRWKEGQNTKVTGLPKTPITP